MLQSCTFGLKHCINSFFSIDLQKFSSHVTHTVQQVNGDVKLNIPEIMITNPATAAKDYEVICNDIQVDDHIGA